MKTSLKATMIMLFTISACALFAQEEKSGFNVNKEYAPGGAKSYKTNNDFIVDYRSDIPIRSFRKFVNHYNDVSNLHWYNVENGFIAQFDASGIQTRVQFDMQGFWCETISNYTPEQTPQKIKNKVKEVYPGFDILITHRIDTNAASVFIVKIENKTQLKTLEIKDGEMKLTADYIKG